MKVRTLTIGAFTLVALMALYVGTASAASRINAKPHVPIYKITLHGAAGISVRGDNSVGIPVVRTDGKSVALHTSKGAYIAVSQNDIQNHELDVTVPANFNLDLQSPNGTIKIDGVRGTMTLATENGTFIINNSTLAGDSNLSTKNGSLEFNGQLEPHSNSSFTGVDASIKATLPANTKLHLHAQADQSGNLTGNFNGLPNNAPRSFDGYLNASQGDPDVANLSLHMLRGSMTVNHQ